MLSSGLVLKPIPSLTRVFQTDADGTHRFSTVEVISENPLDTPNLDPLSYIMKISSTSEENLIQCLRWLLIFTSSGIDISVMTFAQFAQRLEEYDASLSVSRLFLDALLRSVWLRSGSREELQKIIAALHQRLSSRIVDALSDTHTQSDA